MQGAIPGVSSHGARSLPSGLVGSCSKGSFKALELVTKFEADSQDNGLDACIGVVVVVHSMFRTRGKKPTVNCKRTTHRNPFLDPTSPTKSRLPPLCLIIPVVELR